jgi:hypothetical protein
MKRIALAIAVLGLVTAGRTLADDKAETKTQHKDDASGSTTTTESSSKNDAASHGKKHKVEKHVRADGNVETKTDVKHKYKTKGKLGAHKTEVKEKTVKDPQGTVVEHDKTVK